MPERVIYMKKRILSILLAAVVIAAMFSFAGCKNDSDPSSSSASASSSSSSQSSSEESSSSADSSSSAQEEMDTLTFSIGNDMGQNIKSLEIKPADDSKWAQIPLEDIWVSGYMIPVTLTAEEIPDDGLWEIKIVFESDDSEKIFNDAQITEDASLILTEEGIVY